MTSSDSTEILKRLEGYYSQLTDIQAHGSTATLAIKVLIDLLVMKTALLDLLATLRARPNAHNVQSLVQDFELTHQDALRAVSEASAALKRRQLKNPNITRL